MLFFIIYSDFLEVIFYNKSNKFKNIKYNKK